MTPETSKWKPAPYLDVANILAPLSGYTDAPFRQACRRSGCTYAFTPLVDAGSLVFGRETCGYSLLRAEDEPWLGVQLLGASPDIIEKAARILNDGNFDLLDFNMGCPVPKVTKRGAGAALSRNIPMASRCLETLVKVSRFPVTAKIRVLSDGDPEPTVSYALALEKAGIAALTVHGRPWSRIYSGPVSMQIIGAVREALSVPVVANGGVMGRPGAEDLRKGTGCARIMIARGAIGNPWIFRQICDAADSVYPSHEEICCEMERHVDGMMGLYGERAGMIRARKIILSYLTGRGYRRFRRNSVGSLASRRDFEAFIKILREEGVSFRYGG